MHFKNLTKWPLFTFLQFSTLCSLINCLPDVTNKTAKKFILDNKNSPNIPPIWEFPDYEHDFEYYDSMSQFFLEGAVSTNSCAYKFSQLENQSVAHNIAEVNGLWVACHNLGNSSEINYGNVDTEDQRYLTVRYYMRGLAVLTISIWFTNQWKCYEYFLMEGITPSNCEKIKVNNTLEDWQVITLKIEENLKVCFLMFSIQIFNFQPNHHSYLATRHHS